MKAVPTEEDLVAREEALRKREQELNKVKMGDRIKNIHLYFQNGEIIWILFLTLEIIMSYTN